MYSPKQKSKENISRAAANSVGQRKSSTVQTSAFIDNRPKNSSLTEQSADTRTVDTGSHSSKPVQRKVALMEEQIIYDKDTTKGQEEFQNKMYQDQYKRVFDNKNELENYTKGKTDYLGLVKNSWVRLDPKKFYIFGETHNDPAGATPDIIIGLNNKRYVYEPFNAVDDLTESGMPMPNTTKSMQDPAIHAPELVNHLGEIDPTMEDIVLKLAPLLAVLIKFPVENSEKGDDYWHASNTAAKYVNRAVLVAQDISKWDKQTEASQAIADYYEKNSEQLDMAKGLFDKDPSNTGIASYTKFCDKKMLIVFAQLFWNWMPEHVQAKANKHKDEGLAKKGKELAKSDPEEVFTPEHPINAIREREMIKNLIRGRGQGALLGGLGFEHYNNLKKQGLLGKLSDQSHILPGWIAESGQSQNQAYDKVDLHEVGKHSAKEESVETTDVKTLFLRWVTEQGGKLNENDMMIVNEMISKEKTLKELQEWYDD